MSLHLILGVINAGKTTALLSEAARLDSVGLKVLFINHRQDTRTTDEVSTHNPLLSYKGRLQHTTFIKVSNLLDLDVSIYHSIMIDEIHFFDDLIAAVTKFKQNGKHVYAGGLIGDYLCQPFGQNLNLIPLCDNPQTDIRFITAYCQLCADEKQESVVACTSYLIDRKDRNQIVVGETSGPGSKYMTLCRNHYDRMMKKE